MRVALVLAAGSSRRFGRGDKLLARLNGRPLVFHAIEQACAAKAGRIIVVVPSRGGRIGRRIAALADKRIAVIVARHHRQGMAASLAAGLMALRPIEREVLIFLGDMPFASAPRVLRLRSGIDAIRPMVGSVPGHPLLARSAAARRAQGRGEQGLALSLLRVGKVPGRAGNRMDIDTPAALARARRRGSSRRR